MALNIYGEQWEYRDPKGIVRLIFGAIFIGAGCLMLPLPFLRMTSGGEPVGLGTRAFVALFPSVFLLIGYWAVAGFGKVVIDRNHGKLITILGIFPFTLSRKSVDYGDYPVVRLDKMVYKERRKGRVYHITHHPVRLVTPTGAKYVTQTESYTEALQAARSLAVFLNAELEDSVARPKE